MLLSKVADAEHLAAHARKLSHAFLIGFVLIALAMMCLSGANSAFADTQLAEDGQYDNTSTTITTDKETTAEEAEGTEDTEGSESFSDAEGTSEPEQTTQPEQPKQIKVPIAKKAGWVQNEDGGWFYFKKAKGSPAKGWISSNGKWYWMQPDKKGLMAASQWIKDGKKTYYLAKSGVMKTGWLDLKGAWYLLDDSGARVTGWACIKDMWYYLDPSKDGVMRTGKYKVKSTWYISKSSGALCTNGWIETGEGWHYATSSGALKTGWLFDNGKWYWLQAGKGGLALTSATKEIGGELYAFDKNGAMRTECNVKLDKNGCGYANSSGIISRIGIYKDGKIILQNAKGKVLTGWNKLAGSWFYGEKKTGEMHTGWLKLGKTWYYMNKGGAMLTGTQTIDGKRFLFQKSGAWVQITSSTSLDSRIIKLAQSKGSLYACYEWVRNHAHTNWAAGGGVLRYANGVHATTTPWVGSEAKRMLDGQATDCYAYSSCFACLAKALGYDAKVVNGYVPSRSRGWASHSWVEIKQGGTTYVYDPDLGHSIPSVSFYAFTYSNSPTNYKK